MAPATAVDREVAATLMMSMLTAISSAVLAHVKGAVYSDQAQAPGCVPSLFPCCVIVHVFFFTCKQIGSNLPNRACSGEKQVEVDVIAGLCAGG